MIKKILFFSLLLFPSVSCAGTAINFSTITADPITNSFVVLNIFLALYFSFIKFDRFATVHGPEILTTIGICGCFLGIAIALLHFDTEDISKSVPHLLDGVKTSFIVSLSGVFGSLLIRARHYFQRKPIPQSNSTPKASTLDDLVAATQKLQHSLTGNADSSLLAQMKLMRKEQADDSRLLKNSFDMFANKVSSDFISATEKLQHSLTGNADGSLLTQMKLMREEQANDSRLLKNSFDMFADKISEDGSKALIEALKEVVQDFNSHINEQFGENFKHLNSAIENLVVWQKQYKDTLDELQIIQQTSAHDLKEASQGLASFIEQASSFSKTATDLKKTLNCLDQQQKDIDISQKSINDVLSQMKDVTPQFSQKIDEMITSMTQGVGHLQKDIFYIVENFSDQTKVFSAKIEQIIVNSQSDINKSLTNSMNIIHESVSDLDAGLQNELTKSLETLGRQLASLSEKFVSDYTPLTQRLRELVDIASEK